ncbi:MAG: DUF5674 family protein [Patescibacteria group bacterium]
MEIIIIKDKISLERLRELALSTFGDMVKVVVDIERNLMAAGGEMHADCEQVLLDDGSEQKNLWGANIYPEKDKSDWIEYTSLINIRPAVGNRSLEIQDQTIREKVKQVTESLII